MGEFLGFLGNLLLLSLDSQIIPGSVHKMSVKLATIATSELLSELQRRVNCSEQKERHTIFIGPQRL